MSPGGQFYVSLDKDDASIDKFMHIVNSEPSGKPFFKRAQTEDDRKRSETLLRQLPLH
mgnify:CR=1 FL=1